MILPVPSDTFNLDGLFSCVVVIGPSSRWGRGSSGFGLKCFAQDGALLASIDSDSRREVTVFDHEKIWASTGRNRWR